MKLQKGMLSAAAVLSGILLSGCSCPFSCSAPNAKVQASPAPGTVVIDGKIDSKEWAGSKQYPLAEAPLFINKNTPPKYAASQGVDPFEDGKIRLMYDKEYLYVAAKLTDSDLMQYAEKANMGMARTGDWFQVSLKPAKSPSWWVCGVSPDGRSASELIESRGYPVRQDPAVMKGLMAKVTVKGTLNNYKDKDKGWVLEMAIPLKELEKAGAEFKPGASWKILISRLNVNYGSIQGGARFSSVPKLPKQNIQMYEYFADLKLQKKSAEGRNKGKSK